MAVVYCGCTTNSLGSRQGAQYQDRIYGKGMRLLTGAGGMLDASKKRRCTVCGKVHSSGTKTTSDKK